MLQKLLNKTFILILVFLSLASSKACEQKIECVQLSRTPVSQLVIPKVAFFDWDNTVSHVWPPLLEIMNKTITSFGKRALTMEELLNIPCINKPQAEIIKWLFGEQRDDVVQKYWENYHAKHKVTPLEIVEFTKETLAVLKDCGTFIAAVSNQEQHILDMNVENSGLEHYFDVVVGSIRGEHEQNKPNIGVIARTLKNHPHLATQIGQAHPDWWFIGDGDTDLNTALNANCFPVWVTQYAIKHLARFYDDGDHPAGLEVASMEELWKVLKEFNGQ